MTVKNAFYAQSGGVTAVINASACGVIEAARKYPDRIGNVLVGKNGIVGALNEELIGFLMFSGPTISGISFITGAGIPPIPATRYPGFHR